LATYLDSTGHTSQVAQTTPVFEPRSEVLIQQPDFLRAFDEYRLKWQEHRIQVADGVFLAVHVLQDSHAPSVGVMLMIHGLGSNSRYFCSLARHLSSHLRLISVDIRGRGTLY